MMIVQYLQLSLRQPVGITFKMLLQWKDDVDEVDDVLIAHIGLNDTGSPGLSCRDLKQRHPGLASDSTLILGVKAKSGSGWDQHVLCGLHQTVMAVGASSKMVKVLIQLPSAKINSQVVVSNIMGRSRCHRGKK